MLAFPLESLCNLLFELSNEDRLAILHLLNGEALNVTGIARRLGLTTQETSRHVSRLSDIGLTEKDSDGDYNITPYARTVLVQLEGLEFTSENKDYFATHSLESLPREFVSRIGDLADCRFVNDMGAALFLVEKAIKESESYILSITDRIAPSRFLQLMKEAFDRGVTVKTLVSHSDRVVLPSTTEWLDTRRTHEMLEALQQARTKGRLQERMHSRSEVYICMSEKEVAGVAFPYRDGRFDYLGFASMGERARSWCEELFYFYWERSEPRSEVVQRLLDWIKDKPRELDTLKRIATGKDAPMAEETVQGLEEQGLVRQGQLSLLGLLVYRRIE